MQQSFHRVNIRRGRVVKWRQIPFHSHHTSCCSSLSIFKTAPYILTFTREAEQIYSGARKIYGFPVGRKNVPSSFPVIFVMRPHSTTDGQYTLNCVNCAATQRQAHDHLVLWGSCDVAKTLFFCSHGTRKKGKERTETKCIFCMDPRYIIVDL